MPPAKNTPSKPEDEKANVTPTPSAEPTPAPDTAPPAEKKELLSIEEVTSQVLAGRWGATEAVAVDKLSEAGYDLDAVSEEYARRKAGGAPSAF